MIKEISVDYYDKTKKDGKLALRFIVETWEEAFQYQDLAAKLTDGFIIKGKMRFGGMIFPHENGAEVIITSPSVTSVREEYKKYGRLFALNKKLDNNLNFLELFVDALKELSQEKKQVLINEIRSKYVSQSSHMSIARKV